MDHQRSPRRQQLLLRQLRGGFKWGLAPEVSGDFFQHFARELLQLLPMAAIVVDYGGWACNPGSPENCDLREAVYSHGKDGKPVGRGYAVLEIDPSRPEQPVSLEIRSNPRRLCLRVELDCTTFGSKPKNGADAFMSAAVKAITESKADKTAVIELLLTGSLNLTRVGESTSDGCRIVMFNQYLQ